MQHKQQGLLQYLMDYFHLAGLFPSQLLLVNQPVCQQQLRLSKTYRGALELIW